MLRVTQLNVLNALSALLLLGMPGCDESLSQTNLDTAGAVDGPQSRETGAVDANPTIGDGSRPRELGATDGKRGDGSGWTGQDSGPVHVEDGSVLITEDGGTQIVCRPTTCAGKLLECGDCIDNDKDGKVDFRDPECLGPCDNTEGPALESGVGGATGSSCGVDCYFDYGNGPGTDDCWWSHSCDPLSPEASCTYDANMIGTKSCPNTQSKTCADVCLPYTPNGCDCFGCCTFPALTGKGAGGKDVYVWIGAMDAKKNGTCTLATLTDPKACPPCTPVPNCLNPCGRCEVCVGKPLPPADCYLKSDGGVPAKDGSVKDGTSPGSDAGGGSSQCSAGQQPCGLPGQAQCGAGFYCISGCCVRITIQ